MTGKTHYANGQPIFEQLGSTRTYYFKNGVVRAWGRFVGELMEGEWSFNRQSGQLWQVGHFRKNKKNGLWLRYDRDGIEEYRAEFEDDKLVHKVTPSKRQPPRNR